MGLLWIYSIRHTSCLLSNLGELGTHEIDGLLVGLHSSWLLEDGTSGNHHINTGFGNFSDVVNLDTSINFQTAVQSVVINHLAGNFGLFQDSGDEGLSSKSGVDGHEKDDVKLVHDVLGGIKTGGRVEDKSGLASSGLDELKGSVNVVGGFRVEGDVRGTGSNEVLDGSINGGNHEVDIDRGSNSVVTKGLADHGSDGQVGDVVVIHDVKVNNIGTGFEHIVDFLTQPGEIGRKDGRSDQVVLIPPNVQGSRRASRLLGLLYLAKGRVKGDKHVS